MVMRIPRMAMVIAECDDQISSATAYSKEHLEDMPKIRDWTWNS